MDKSFRALPVLLALAAVDLWAQGAPPGKKMLTPEIVTSAGRRGGGPSRLTWRPGTDEVAYLKREGANREAKTKLVLHDAVTGRERTVPEPSGAPSLNLASYQWSSRVDRLIVLV